MDFSGLSEQDAEGWQRGLYRDVRRTFGAPVVNAVVRVPMALDPEVTRYAWGQLKPVFETRAFDEFARDYRDAMCTPVEVAADLPTYSPGTLGIPPGEFAELRGQTATFGVVAPRLDVTMELLDRGFHGDPVGGDPDGRRAATEPSPAGGQRQPRDGPEPRPPTLLDADATPAELDDVVAAIRAHHGFEDGLATVHRCHAQWPAFLAAAWEELSPVLASDAYAGAFDRVDALVAEFVDSVPYRPRLAPDDLAGLGVDDERVSQLQELARTFTEGPPRTVVRTIPLYALLLGVVGPRGR
jgi:hypothetical protein